MQNERRLSIRKPLERLAYISLPYNNGGIVLDVSEGGVGFHSIAPVEVDGPIQFRFAVDSARRIKAVGELAWKDETGKTGGLRFTELPDDVREHIRAWLGQQKAKVIDVPVGEPVTEADVAPGSEIDLAPVVDLPIVEPIIGANIEISSEVELAAVVDLPVDEPAIAADFAPGSEVDLARVAASERPLLYNLKPPVYSAPSYELSMFSAEGKSKAEADLAAPQGSFPSRHPVAALVLTIFLASVVGSGIFAYVSTSQAGNVLYYLKEKVWDGIHSRPIPKSPAPPAISAPDSSKTPQR